MNGEDGDLWNALRLLIVALGSAVLSATLVIGVGSAVMKPQRTAQAQDQMQRLSQPLTGDDVPLTATSPETGQPGSMPLRGALTNLSRH